MAAAKRAPAKSNARAKSKADEANPLVAEAEKHELPAACPGLWPFYALPRRQRGDAIRAFEAAYSALGEYEDLEDASNLTEAEQIGLLGKLYDALAAIEDALELAAVDRAAFREFAANCTDEELMQAFSWYARTFSPGEAEGSQG